MAKMTLERAVGVLESMYCAHLLKIDRDRAEARKFAKCKNAEFKQHVALLKERIKVREESAQALGTVIDALRKGVRRG